MITASDAKRMVLDFKSKFKDNKNKDFFYLFVHELEEKIEKASLIGKEKIIYKIDDLYELASENDSYEILHNLDSFIKDLEEYFSKNGFGFYESKPYEDGEEHYIQIYWF